VFRHASATHVEIAVTPVSSRQAGARSVETEAVAVSVRDNGAGLPTDHKQGLGMIGMRERVLALGGTMTVVSTSQGLTVEALVPSRMEQLQPVEQI
jgi:two-component system sensor histidine kinase UhpB